LTAYGTIGLIFGLVGKGFYGGNQQNLSIFIGIRDDCRNFDSGKIFAKYNFSKPVFVLISKIRTTLGSQFRNKSYKSLFDRFVKFFTLWYGLALFGAIAMQNASFGVLYMVLFGLGTVPMMSSVVYINSA
jgi:hypothetical protein